MAPDLPGLYSRYMALDRVSQQKFLTAINAAPKAAAKSEQRGTPERLPAILYERLCACLYEYRGIRLPRLGALQRVDLNALDEAWRWVGGPEADRTTAAGLIEMVADAVGREILPKQKSGVYAAKHLLHLLQHIPEAVDIAYPGYRQSGLLPLIAKSIGNGKLPINKRERGDDE